MSSEGLVGGYTEERPVAGSDEEIQKIVTELKKSLEEKTGKGEYKTFEAVKYRSQVVAGTNYLVKVKVGDGEKDFVHVKIFKPLPQENRPPEITAYQENKTAEEALEVF